MSKIDEIMRLMQNIKYGFLDKNGNNIFDNKNEKSLFNSIYRLMSPQELLEKKVGVCWDQVELERTLFDKNEIKNETYFIYIDDQQYLPSHTFLVYYLDNKVYWFEHAWQDATGIHQYNNINDLLNDVEIKFRKSRKNEVALNLDIYIYKYHQPQYHISCDKLYKYIFTQEKVLNYQLKNATVCDLDRIKDYKLKTIVEYAKNLSDEEMQEINDYVDKTAVASLNQYKNIIYNRKTVGSLLVKNIKDGILLDEIFIENQFRNMGIGTSVINSIVQNCHKNVYLWVYKANTKAVKLYKKLGFVIQEKTVNRFYMKLVK